MVKSDHVKKQFAHIWLMFNDCQNQNHYRITDPSEKITKQELIEYLIPCNWEKFQFFTQKQNKERFQSRDFNHCYHIDIFKNKTRQSLKKIQHKNSIQSCGSRCGLRSHCLVSETQFHRGMFSGTCVFKRFLSCFQGLECLVKWLRRWFSTVELVRRDNRQVTRGRLHAATKAKNPTPVLASPPTWPPAPSGRSPTLSPCWPGRPSGRPSCGRLWKKPSHSPQGWLSPWLQDPKVPPKKSPLEELASGLQEVSGDPDSRQWG